MLVRFTPRCEVVKRDDIVGTSIVPVFFAGTDSTFFLESSASHVHAILQSTELEIRRRDYVSNLAHGMFVRVFASMPAVNS